MKEKREGQLIVKGGKREKGKGRVVEHVPEAPAIHRWGLWQGIPNPNNPQLATNHSK